MRLGYSNKARAVHEHVHDHVNVHVDVHVDVIGFFLTVRESGWAGPEAPSAKLAWSRSLDIRVALIELPRTAHSAPRKVVRLGSSNNATAVHDHEHDHVNVDVDVHVRVDVIGFSLTARVTFGLPQGPSAKLAWPSPEGAARG